MQHLLDHMFLNSNVTKIFMIFFICSNFFTINSEEILSQSGPYILGTDIILDQANPGDAIFRITADNVQLDLGGNFLSFTGTTVGSVHAIIVDPNVKNTSIANGRITAFTGVGILINDGCSQIHINDLSIDTCMQAGILCDGLASGTGIDGLIATNCFMSSCTGAEGNPAYGMRMIQTTNANISECYFFDNDAQLTTSGFGLSLESCSNCSTTNCKFLSNGGNRLGAGVNVTQSNVCEFINCQASSNLSHDSTISATGVGFWVDGSSSTNFSACQAINNLNNNGSGIGYKLFDGRANTIVNCVGQSNTGGPIAIGVVLTGTETNSAILDSQFIANIANVITGTSYGILIEGPQGCAIANNIISANVGASGIGLKDTTLDTNNYIAGNLSYANTTTGYVVNFTTGSLPVQFATNNNFSAIETISKYVNIAIIP